MSTLDEWWNRPVTIIPKMKDDPTKMFDLDGGGAFKSNLMRFLGPLGPESKFNYPKIRDNPKTLNDDLARVCYNYNESKNLYYYLYTHLSQELVKKSNLQEYRLEYPVVQKARATPKKAIIAFASVQRLGSDLSDFVNGTDHEDMRLDGSGQVDAKAVEEYRRLKSDAEAALDGRLRKLETVGAPVDVLYIAGFCGMYGAKGAGRSLMQHIQAKEGNRGPIVLWAVDHALVFYKKMGFEKLLPERYDVKCFEGVQQHPMIYVAPSAGRTDEPMSEEPLDGSEDGNASMTGSDLSDATAAGSPANVGRGEAIGAAQSEQHAPGAAAMIASDPTVPGSPAGSVITISDDENGDAAISAAQSEHHARGPAATTASDPTVPGSPACSVITISDDESDEDSRRRSPRSRRVQLDNYPGHFSDPEYMDDDNSRQSVCDLTEDDEYDCLLGGPI